MEQPRTSNIEPQASEPRGGRRPGAGAPRRNLNAFKTGRYSKRLAALRAALDAMPKTAGALVQMTGRDRRKMEAFAHGLQSYVEILLLVVRGGSIDDLADPQLRQLALYAIPIKQSAIRRRNRRVCCHLDTQCAEQVLSGLHRGQRSSLPVTV